MALKIYLTLLAVGIELAALSVFGQVGSFSFHDPAISFRPPVDGAGSGAVFYVDALTGNDANSGTSPSAAWQHPHYAATNSAVSNHCLIQLTSGEVFPETNFIITNMVGLPNGSNVVWTTTGTAPATISNWLTSNPAERATGVESGFSCLLIDSQNVTFSNLNFVGSSSFPAHITQGTNGAYAFLIEQMKSYTANITFSNCGFEDESWQGLFITPVSGSGIVISNLGLTSCWFNANACGGVASYYTTGNGLSFANIGLTNCVISNCIGNDVNYANGLFFVNVSNLWLVNDVAHDGGRCTNKSVNAGGVAAGFQYGVNCLIMGGEYYNWFADDFSDGDGVNIDNNTWNCCVEYAYIHNNAGAGIFQNGSYGSNCYRFNVCISNGLAGTDTIPHPYEVQVENVSGGSGSLSNMLIYGNNFIATAGGVQALDLAMAPSGPAVIANNILWVSNSSPSIALAGSAWMNWNNDYDRGDGAAFSVQWNAMTYSSIAAWQAATGQDDTAITANPDWLNGFSAPVLYPSPASGSTNWILLASVSPLVGAAADLNTHFGINNGGVDFLGDPIGATSYAVGAVNESQ